MSLVFENIFSNEHITQVNNIPLLGIEQGFLDKMMAFIKDCNMSSVEFSLVEVNMVQPATLFGTKKTCKMLRIKDVSLPKYEAYYKASLNGCSVTFSKYETMVKGFFDTLSGKSAHEIELSMRKNLGFIDFEKYISLTMTMDILFKKTISIFVV